MKTNPRSVDHRSTYELSQCSVPTTIPAPTSGPSERAGAAEDDHHDGHRGPAERGDVGTDELGLPDDQDPGDPGEQAGQHRRRRTSPGSPNTPGSTSGSRSRACRAGRARTATDARHRAEGRHRPGTPPTVKQVEGRRAGQRIGSLDPGQPVLAARDRGQLECEPIDDDSERERDHQEHDPACPHRRQPVDGRNDQRDYERQAEATPGARRRCPSPTRWHRPRSQRSRRGRSIRVRPGPPGGRRSTRAVRR